MSVPVSKYTPIFNLLSARHGNTSATLPRYTLDMTIAGLILTERHESFTKKELYRKLVDMGYVGREGPFAYNFRDIAGKQIFIRKDHRYKFNRELLKQKKQSTQEAPPNPSQ